MAFNANRLQNGNFRIVELVDVALADPRAQVIRITAAQNPFFFKRLTDVVGAFVKKTYNQTLQNNEVEWGDIFISGFLANVTFTPWDNPSAQPVCGAGNYWHFENAPSPTYVDVQIQFATNAAFSFFVVLQSSYSTFN